MPAWRLKLGPRPLTLILVGLYLIAPVVAVYVLVTLYSMSFEVAVLAALTVTIAVAFPARWMYDELTG